MTETTINHNQPSVFAFKCQICDEYQSLPEGMTKIDFPVCDKCKRSLKEYCLVNRNTSYAIATTTTEPSDYSNFKLGVRT